MSLIAITREVSQSIEGCELTHLERQEIDVDAARAQHRKYEDCLGDWELVDVDFVEPMRANPLLIGETLVYPSAYPRTRRRLADRAIAVRTFDASELAKAEGAVTCCSLIFDTGRAEAPAAKR